MENEISYHIIGAAIEVHKTLGGPGLLESIYVSSLCHELSLRGLNVEREVMVPVEYKGTVISDPLLIDILVEEKVIIEAKASFKDNIVYQAQLLTYLRLTDLRLGLLINFGKCRVRDGILRIVNNL